MIRVSLPPPPDNYESQVRAPGQTFLSINPHPTRSDWQQHRYWSAIHNYLYGRLNGICAYCSTFTPQRHEPASLNHTSIDHFVPKSVNHALAYEWTNFRLCRERLNNRKSSFQDVLDPCAIQNGWFRLNFTTFALSPDPGLPANRQQQVRDTLGRLQLNLDDAYVNERAQAVYRYADNQLNFATLARYYPFIAIEMLAQKFDEMHLPRFQVELAKPRIRAVLVRQGLID